LMSVRLTAGIKPLAPGGGVPTGEVTFELVTTTKKKVKVTTLARLSQERIRREIRHFAQSVQFNMFVLKLGPLERNDNRIRAVCDEISKIVTNSDVAHLEFHWVFWHL
jgi:hypothetical protein